MLFLENFNLAFTALKSNKTRALLTMLGIIIGIASVITIMTVGNSMLGQITEQMSSRGANKIQVSVTQKSDNDMNDIFGMMGMGFGMGGGPRRSLRDDDYITSERIEKTVEEFGERIEGVSYTESVGNGTVRDGSNYAYVSVTGANDAEVRSADLELLSGRDFYAEDFTEGRRVALVSDYFCNNLYKGDTDAVIGEQVTAFVNNKYQTFTVVGVYKYESSGANFSDSEYDTRTTLYLPFKAAQEITHNNKGFSQISFLASSIDDASTLSDDIKEYMNSKFYRNNATYEVSCFSTQSMIETYNSSISMMSTAVAVVAGISLLVGGIGVMNIMMVSITERTREIGTRKALGATNGSIKLQFVMEAIVLCFVGGLIGIVLGITIGVIVSKYMGYPAAPSMGSVVFSTLFSVAIGVFFGYYPAKKAANMNPIDALRYE